MLLGPPHQLFISRAAASPSPATASHPIPYHLSASLRPCYVVPPLPFPPFRDPLQTHSSPTSPLPLTVGLPYQHIPSPLQAAAILKAEVHGIPRSSYASSAAKVAEQAAKVPVAPFQPRKGVHIETDPKADKKASAAAAPAGDDESIIEGLLSKLAAAKSGLPEGYKLSPVQVSRARGDRRRHLA